MYQPTGNTVVQGRALGDPLPVKQRQLLHCVCCGAEYLAGEWRCCAPAAGQSSHAWHDMWCDQGTGPDHIRHCPRHPEGCAVCSQPKPALTLVETKREVDEIVGAAASGHRTSEAAADQGWVRI